MRATLLRDLLILRNKILITCIALAIYSLIFVFTDMASFAGTFVVIFSGILVFYAMKSDEQYRWTEAVLSACRSRRGAVLEKYVLYVILLMIGSLVSVGVIFFLGIFIGFNYNPDIQLYSFAVMVMALILESIFIPMSFKKISNNARAAMFICSILIIPAAIFLGPIFNKTFLNDSELVSGILIATCLGAFAISYRVSLKIVEDTAN